MSAGYLLLLLLTGGCIKEKFDPSDFDASLNLTPGLAIPVGFSHLGFEEYLGDTPLTDNLRISDDGFLSLYYSAEIDSGIMGELLSINDASTNEMILNQTGAVVFLNAPGSTFILTDSIQIPVIGTQSDARIDSVSLLSGSLRIDITSVNITGNIIFQLPGLEQNGVPVSVTRNLSNPDFTLALGNYTLIPEHDVSGNNLLKCRISVQIQSPSGPVNPGEAFITVQSNLSGLEYETIYGDFGGYEIDIPAQSVSTPFFRQLTGGQIFFADPEFKLYFANSAGVPFGISFSRIDAIDRNMIHYPLTGQGIPVTGNPKIINYPTLNQAGVTVEDSLIFNKDNSNLPEFIASSPDSIAINVSVEITDLTPPLTSFINYDSEYRISAAIELPLWGKADFLILLDTLPFDYLGSTLPPPDELEKLVVRTSIINSFPVTALPQIYLLNDNYVLIDSLFTGTEKIEGASDTNGDGKADPYKQAPIDIDLPRSKIDNLFNTRHLLVRGRISTTDFPAEDVKLYSTYFLDYSVGIIAQLKIKTGK